MKGRFLDPKWSELVFIDTKDEALTISIEAYPQDIKNYPGYDVDLSMPLGLFL